MCARGTGCLYLITYFQAEKRIFEKQLDHEYAPIAGVGSFVKAAAELVFGKDAPVLQQQRVSSLFFASALLRW